MDPVPNMVTPSKGGQGENIAPGGHQAGGFGEQEGEVTPQGQWDGTGYRQEYFDSQVRQSSTGGIEGGVKGQMLLF